MSRRSSAYTSDSPSMGLPVPSNTRPRISPESAIVIGLPRNRVHALSMSMPLVPSKASSTTRSPSISMTLPRRLLPSGR